MIPVDMYRHDWLFSSRIHTFYTFRAIFFHQFHWMVGGRTENLMLLYYWSGIDVLPLLITT